MGSIKITRLGKAYKQYPTRWSRLLEWFSPFKIIKHQLKWVLQDLTFSVTPGEAVKRIPRKETIILRQNVEALGIKAELERNGLTPELHRKIDAHVAEFEWVGTHHVWGEPFSKEKFFAEIKSLGGVSKESEAKTLSLPVEIDFLARAAGEAGFLRQYSAEVFDVVAFKARPLMTQIAKSSSSAGEISMEFSSVSIVGGASEISSLFVLFSESSSFIIFYYSNLIIKLRHLKIRSF